MGLLGAGDSLLWLDAGRRSAVTEVTPEGTSQINYAYDNLYRLTNETRTGDHDIELYLFCLPGCFLRGKRYFLRENGAPCRRIPAWAASSGVDAVSCSVLC